MVYFFFAEGFEETEAITPLDMVRRAGVAAKTVSISKKKEVTGSHGITIVCDMLLKDIPDETPDMVVLPGGMPGAKNLRACSELCALLENTAAKGGMIAAICAAPYILGELGLLEGKKATCYPGFEDRLTGAEVRSERVVRDGRLITAAGMGVALGFGKAIVDALCGKKEADRIQDAILMA